MLLLLVTKQQNYVKGQRDCSTSYMRKSWESWDCLAWRREGSGASYQCTEIPERNVQRRQSQALFFCAQWQDKRQWAQTETQVPFEHLQKTFLLWGDRELAVAAQRGCRVSTLRHIKKNKSKHRPGRLGLGGPAWAVGLDQMTSRGLFQPQPFCVSVSPWRKIHKKSNKQMQL